jgi:hypothetical protein
MTVLSTRAVSNFDSRFSLRSVKTSHISVSLIFCVTMLRSKETREIPSEESIPEVEVPSWPPGCHDVTAHQASQVTASHGIET